MLAVAGVSIILAGLLSGLVFRWPVAVVASLGFAFIAVAQWFFGELDIAEAMIWFVMAAVIFQASFLTTATVRTTLD